MKDIIRNNKALLIVLSGAIIIMLLIIVPFMIFGEKNEKAKIAKDVAAGAVLRKHSLMKKKNKI